VPAIAAIIALSLIGGLAVACFAKAFGIVFLGEPRTLQAAQAHESDAAMRWPMVVLAVLCLLIGLSAPLILVLLKPVLAQVAGDFAPDPSGSFDQIQTPLAIIVGVSLIFALLIAALSWLRFTKLSGRERERTVTWDCAYARPTPRMQYTASSFAQPFTDLVAGLLRLSKYVRKPDGYFPAGAAFSSNATDVCTTSLWTPLFKATEWLLLRFRWMQTGSIHLYILYIAISLIVLLIWKLS
jgi:hydrogenase-4 component B